MTETSYEKPIPDLDDPLMAPFWKGAIERKLLAHACRGCGALHFPALPICPECLETELEWVEVSPVGEIWSYVVYHRAFHPGFQKDLPYVVAIVETERGVRYTGRVIGPRDEVVVGARVQAVFSDEAPGFTLVKWALVDGNGT